MVLGSLTAWPLALAPTAGHPDALKLVFAAVLWVLHVILTFGLLKLLLIAAAWILTLLVHPFGRCFLCWGKGMRIKGRKARKCWLCKGKGRRQRTGSRTVHRIRRLAAAGWRARRDGAR